MFVIVPDILRDQIYLRMAEEFLAINEQFWPSSENWQSIYHELLAYFDEHGTIPNFSLQRRTK